MVSISKIVLRRWYKNKWASINGGVIQDRTKALGEKPVPVLLCTPRVPRSLAWYWTRLRGEGLATDRLNHGMASRLRHCVVWGKINHCNIQQWREIHVVCYQQREQSLDIYRPVCWIQQRNLPLGTTYSSMEKRSKPVQSRGSRRKLQW